MSNSTVNSLPAARKMVEAAASIIKHYDPDLAKAFASAMPHQRRALAHAFARGLVASDDADPHPDGLAVVGAAISESIYTRNYWELEEARSL